METKYVCQETNNRKHYSWVCSSSLAPDPEIIKLSWQNGAFNVITFRMMKSIPDLIPGPSKKKKPASCPSLHLNVDTQLTQGNQVWGSVAEPKIDKLLGKTTLSRNKFVAPFEASGELKKVQVPVDWSPADLRAPAFNCE